MLIQYVGKKKLKSDNVNNTGVTWIKLEVKEYPDHLAPALLKYTDIWAKYYAADSTEDRSDGENSIEIESVKTDTNIDGDNLNEGEDKTSALPALTELLSGLDKSGLIAFAKQENVTYSNSMNEDQIRNKILRELNK